MADIRAFLAMKPPSDVQASLANLQQSLRPFLPLVNWVPPENIHVTLKFLGNIPSEMVFQLHDLLKEVGPQRSVFMLAIQGLGVFPDLRSPKVLWAGLAGSVERLIELHDQLHLLIEPLGFPLEDKAFHPHVTLARIKSHWREVGAALRERASIQSQEVVSEWLIDSFVLYRSELSSSGVHYDPLWTVPLSRSSAN